MSGTTLSAWVDEDTEAAVEQLAEDRDITNSKAAGNALQAGLGRLGYHDARTTPVRGVINHISTGTFFVGTTLVALSLRGSLSLLGAGLGALAAALALSIAARLVVPRLEPNLTNRLPQIEVKR